jgi:hypothetical protein
MSGELHASAVLPPRKNSGSCFVVVPSKVGRSGNEERQNRNCTSQRLKTNCSGDTALHACGSVTDAPPSLALLQEIREMGNQRTNDRTELVFGDKNRREIH